MSEPAPFRAGFCALIGLPNVGKSTLLNRLIGRKLSIVTHKAQTTRRRLLGIYSDAGHQAVFVDTPGLLEPRYLLQESMLEEAEAAREEADVLVYVVDAGYPDSVQAGLEYPVPDGLPALLCLNKIDRIEADAQRRMIDSFSDRGWEEVCPTVATEGEGIEELRGAILSRLPESPPFYPTDEIATAPVRFFVAEMVRETCFEVLAQEVPYSTAVEVEEFREAEEPIYISASIYVERSSQKGIVIGRGGRMIRRIGSDARRKIEEFVGRSVYLDLRVKVLANWRRKRSRLARLGFHLPREER